MVLSKKSPAQASTMHTFLSLSLSLSSPDFSFNRSKNEIIPRRQRRTKKLPTYYHKKRRKKKEKGSPLFQREKTEAKIKEKSALTSEFVWRIARTRIWTHHIQSGLSRPTIWCVTRITIITYQLLYSFQRFSHHFFQAFGFFSFFPALP